MVELSVFEKSIALGVIIANYALIWFFIKHIKDFFEKYLNSLEKLNDDIVNQPKDFRKWVILHEFAHHFDFIHEDKIYIMYPYLEGKYDIALEELTEKIIEKHLDN